LAGEAGDGGGDLGRKGLEVDNGQLAPEVPGVEGAVAGGPAHRGQQAEQRPLDQPGVGW
jgi:hypothetical protein